MSSSFLRGSYWLGGVAVLVLVSVLPASAQDLPEVRKVAEALSRAVTFFHGQVAVGGGYVWRYSGDLQLREGEGVTDGTQVIWVQPPGTPTVGQAFLEAYAATQDARYLQAARDAAAALLSGQMHSGGWYYSIELDPGKRQEYAYRDLPQRSVSRWYEATTLDDDTTQAAVRFLMRYDELTGFRDERVHEAVGYALASLLAAQYPNGAWPVNWITYPSPADPAEFPVLAASYPPEWPRRWPKTFAGCYVLNDDLIADMVQTMLQAWDTYGDQRYFDSACRAGGFLLLAQMPEPQPAWAQQYNRQMHPEWARKFEPPAVVSHESMGAMETLLLLYRRTGDRKYLEPIPRALAYLRASLLPDGRIARFYELQTNRPLYFTRDYQLTYEANDLPTHYSFILQPSLDRVEAEYQAVAAARPDQLWPLPAPPAPSAAEVARVIAALDERGAWVEPGPTMDAHDLKPPSGVIQSQTFVENVSLLCRYLRSAY
ncbi:MAG: polysaccharide lyase [Armatimonadetes bacterium]|nr:polysaccharide lyase [Armatimonadota bacterium]